LSYARVIQANQLRKKDDQLPGNYEKLDVTPMLTEIVSQVPDTTQGAAAVMYLAQPCFISERKEDNDAGFEIVERYLAGQETVEDARKKQGDETVHTVPVHLFIQGQYVNLRGDYAGAFKHAKKAYELGITKEITERAVLFELGRMCDIKLNRKDEARAYYEDFLKKYPNAQQTPLAKRYLADLGGK